MKIILISLLTMASSYAGLKEFRERFERQAIQGPSAYDLSLTERERPADIMEQVTRTEGLEVFVFEKMISKKEIDQFIAALFASSRKLPDFCHQLVGEIADSSAFKKQCKKIIADLVAPLKDDSLEISFFQYQGNNAHQGDFHMAKLHAYDASSKQSIALNISVESQTGRQ